MTKFNEGDQVYINSFGYGAMSRGVVARVTATQAIVGEGARERRFNRETGRLVGGSTWNTARIDHPTPSLDAEWRRVRSAAAARHLSAVAGKGDAVEIRKAFTAWERAVSDE